MRQQWLDEGRITHIDDWERYTLFDINFVPKLMTQKALRDGFLDLTDRLYRDAFNDKRRKAFRHNVRNHLRVHVRLPLYGQALKCTSRPQRSCFEAPLFLSSIRFLKRTNSKKAASLFAFIVCTLSFCPTRRFPSSASSWFRPFLWSCCMLPHRRAEKSAIFLPHWSSLRCGLRYLNPGSPTM